LVRECRFKNSFIFKYSPRPGTKADDLLPDDIPEETKRRRNNELLALQNAISEEDNAALIGRDFEVLVEGLSKATLKEQSKEPGRDGPSSVAVVGEREAATITSERHAPSLDVLSQPVDDPHPQLVGRTRCD